MDDAYTPRQVEVLLGLHEGLASQGQRHVTVMDLISWASDPGGDTTWLVLLQRFDPADAWTSRRGPLAPGSDWACVLYDFARAVSRLPLLEQAIVALTAMGFSPSEIAAVIDPDGVIQDVRLPTRESARALERRRRRLARMLEGRPRRDANDQEIRDENGDLVYTGGIAVRLARLMSGERR